MLATSNADIVSEVCHFDLSKLVHGRNNHDQAQMIALLPSLRELTIWLLPHSDAFQARPLIRSPNHQHTSIVRLQGLALKIVQERVRVLAIQSDPKYKWAAAHVIKLPGFRNLENPTVSMEHLGMPNMIGFYRANGSLIGSHQGNAGKHPCIPLTLKCLHLTLCTRHTFALLHVFDSFAAGQLHLRHIALAFDMPAVPAIILCSASHTKLEPLYKKARRWLRRLTNLAYKCHHVEFLTDDSSSFTGELEAVTKPLNTKLALVAGKGLKFSECVARNMEGSRTRSSAERRLFLLHGVRHLQLFCSPTFDFIRWIEVVFFHGDRGAKSKSRKMARTFRYVIDSRLSSFTTTSPSLDFSFRVVPQHTSSLQQVPVLVTGLETTISLPAMSKPQTSRHLARSRRDVEQEPASPTLIFNGKAAEPSTKPSDLRSKFVASNFMEEDWMWYL